ncbi:hypothetical protein [Bowdeniella massiliensis]|uniref:hypothetical protein n=1 Tax=Bowdeniella massiliensis TaxID=2932264 RepID=UPI0020278710|nr:hypothetical protein [Bowdeniella massiliensis]
MLKGSQDARYYLGPHIAGMTEEVGESIIDFGIEHRYFLDPWQEKGVLLWTRVTPEGRWVAKTWVGTAARQNGKNGSLEVVEAYMMAVLGLKILHTSHRLKTSRAGFKRLERFFGKQKDDPAALNPDLNDMVVEFRKANGQEEILLNNGGRIVIGTRSSGAGRGETFDVLVVDEAQEYEPEEQEALEPTISAAPSGDPVVIFLGTPPAAISEKGAPFVKVRNQAVTGKAKSTAYFEHSAPGEVDKMREQELEAFVRDRTNWQSANPALGIRISETTIEGELDRMSPRSFARERLNMWPTPVDDTTKAIDKKLWKKRALKNPSSEWPLAAIGLDMNPERSKVTIAMAVYSDTGVHVELAANAPFNDEGTEALVEWVMKRARRRIPIVIDSFSPARSFEPYFKRKKAKLFILQTSEFGQACMGLYDGIKEGTVTHFNQTTLNLSADGATKDAMGKGGAWKFARQNLDVELQPIIAVACARFGAIKFNSPPKSGGTKPRPNHAFV